jgi:hypothetical protein
MPQQLSKPQGQTIVIALDARARELFTEMPDQLGIAIRKTQGADSPLSGSQEHATEITIRNGVPNECM